MEGNIKTFCVDASFVLSFLLPDETARNADDVIDQYSNGDINLFSTLLLPFEVLNGLKTAVKRKRITKKLAGKLALDFLNLEIPLESVDFVKAFDLSQRRDLTVYDASYVLCSKMHNATLLTLDKKLSN